MSISGHRGLFIFIIVIHRLTAQSTLLFCSTAVRPRRSTQTRFYYKFNLCAFGGCPLCARRVSMRNRCGVPRVSGRSAGSVVPKLLAATTTVRNVFLKKITPLNNVLQLVYYTDCCIEYIWVHYTNICTSLAYWAGTHDRRKVLYLNSSGNVPTVQRCHLNFDSYDYIISKQIISDSVWTPPYKSVWWCYTHFICVYIYIIKLYV